MDQLFEQKPWMTDFSGIAGLPPGMLGHHEAALLHVLARDYFRGHGEIVDAGAFLGASSWCFTKGLEENARIAAKSGRVHAYDLFQIWSEPGGTDLQMADWIRRGYGVELAGYESTIGIYAANLGALARHVRVHQGDILKTRWPGRPIELMLVDICKIKPIWQHMIESFFPSLIPGVSLVIHQDWHHPWLPYLHVGQEALSDYFELVVAKANDTAVFRLRDRIPERVLDRVSAYEFTPEEELALMDRAVARFDEHKAAAFVRLARAELLRQQGRVSEASRAVHEAVAHHPEPRTEVEQHWFSTHAASVAERIEAGLVDEPPPGFDSLYLSQNPDLDEALKSQHFKSGFHHWFRHGRWEGREPLAALNGVRKRGGDGRTDQLAPAPAERTE